MKEATRLFSQDCLSYLKSYQGEKVDLTFLDPPFNQGKDYKHFDDNQTHAEYWSFIDSVLDEVYRISGDGGCIYFMQREKNTQFVLSSLQKTGWTFQNLLIWKKMSAAVPVKNKFSKSYQVIVYATKGLRAKTFHKLRISPPIPPNYKYERENGIYVTDVWDDIRELTAGYFASSEAIRTKDGSRFHKQQAPLSLLLRILLSSSKVGDLILDPFAGTGTTLVTALQLKRQVIGIEIDPQNISCCKKRLREIKQCDSITKLLSGYHCTPNFNYISGIDSLENDQNNLSKISLEQPKLALG